MEGGPIKATKGFFVQFQLMAHGALWE
jgi:hypothetical protein